MSGFDKTRQIYRSERLKTLSKALAQYPLTILEAPMGYGKSTAVREALAISGHLGYWVHLFESDRHVYWHSFCGQVGNLSSEVGQKLAQMGFPDSPALRLEAITLLGGIPLNSHVYLVIDDYHMVSTPENDQWLVYLIKHQLPYLHVILTARTLNFDRLEELAYKGQVLHINQDQLALKLQEVQAYYKQCGIKLTLADAKSLQAITDGWISALYLMMVAYKESGHFESHLKVHQLIGNAFYLTQSPQTRYHMVCLCFSDQLTARDIALLTGLDPTEAHSWLRGLSKLNAFIKYDATMQTFQIHDLLLRYLKTQFNLLTSDDQKLIYGRYAKVKCAHEAYAHALHYYYLAQDFEGLMKVMTVDKGNCIHHEQKDDLVQYFDQCPIEVLVQCPSAQLIYALCLFSFNDMARFEQACGTFMTLMAMNSNLPEADKNNLMGEFEILLSFTTYNDIEAMHSHIQLASSYMNRPAHFVDTKSSWTFGAPSVLYMFYRESGKLERAVAQLEEAIETYSALTEGHGRGGDTLMRAEWFFARGDYLNAEIAVHQAMSRALRHKQGDILLCCRFLMARMALSKGQFAELADIIQNMRSEVEHNNWYNLIHTLELCEAFLKVTLGEVVGVEAWILEGDLEGSHLYFPTTAYLDLVYGRSLLIRQEYARCLGESERFLENAGVFPNLLSAIYANIYMAVANHHLFRQEAALDALKTALELAAPDQMLMPFVENGESLLPMLQGLAKEKWRGSNFDFTSFFEAFQGLMAPYTLAKHHSVSKHFDSLQASLTAREMEIAKLAAEGYTNKAIGEQLFISTNTVKMSLKSIFAKLDIHNRALLAEKLPTG